MTMKPNTRYIHPIGPQFSLIHKDKEMNFLSLVKSPVVIGLTGPSKVGKTQIAKYLVTEHNFAYIGLTLPLKDISKKLGHKNPSWEELGEIGCMLREHLFCGILAKYAIDEIKKNHRGDERIVLDGILHPSEIDLFEDSFQNFYLLGIIANDKLRAKKAIEWGAIKSIENLVERDKFEQVNVTNDNMYSPNVFGCMKRCWKILEITRFTRKIIFENTDKTLQEILALYDK